MRKTRITMIISIVLVAGILFSGFSYLKAEDKLDYSYRVLYGDMAAAAGMEINGKCFTDSYYSGMSADLWKIDYTIDGNKVEMKDKAIFAEHKYDYEPYWYDFSLSLSGYIGRAVGLGRAAEECYRRLQEAKEKDGNVTSVKVPLKELFEYYPLSVRLRGGDYYFFHSDEASGELKKDYEDLNNFFRIPVLPDDYLTVGWGNPDKYANYYSFSNEIQISSEGKSYGNISISNAVSPDYIFLFFNDKLPNGMTVDTSHIPGGYGIYRLPYELHEQQAKWDRNNPETELYTEELVNFYPLDEKKKLLDVCYNDYDNSLFVVTIEEGAEWLTIVDPESGDEKQRICLATAEEVEAGMAFEEFDFGENYCIMNTLWGKARNGVLVKNSEGTFEKKVDFTVTDDFLIKYNNTFNWGRPIDRVYKDGKTAFLFRKLEEHHDYFNDKKVMSQSGTDLVLVVFKGNDPAFIGEINNSLCEADYNHYTNYFLTDGNNQNIYGNNVIVGYEMIWE